MGMTESEQFQIPRRGIILVVCGPAGSGKTTLCDQMLDRFPGLRRVVTATTREPRPGEAHGVDYHFMSEAAFMGKVESGGFLEHARVHGRLYGTLKSEVRRHLEAECDVLLNIDVQGAASFRRQASSDPLLAGRLATVFIQPESLDMLRERLEHRKSDSAEEISRRMETAREELKSARLHDYILPTQSREHDFQVMASIYTAEKHRVAKVTP